MAALDPLLTATIEGIDRLIWSCKLTLDQQHQKLYVEVADGSFG